MDPVVIQRKEETENGWRFIVELGTHEENKIGFAVSIDREYWQNLTLGKFPPEFLVRETFRFLLAKEGIKTALLRSVGHHFDLRDIAEHYYSHERRMKMALFGTEYPEREMNV